MEKASIPMSSGEAQHFVSELKQNYDLLRQQTNQGFIFAIVFMGLGIIVILAGAFGQLFGLATSGSDLTSIAGIIVEVLSGTAIWVYRINFKRLTKVSDGLDHTFRILTAFRQVDSLPDYERNVERVKLIDELKKSFS